MPIQKPLIVYLNPIRPLARYAILSLLLAACGQKPMPPSTPQTTPAFNPTTFTHGTIYNIDPILSDLQIQVYRGGTFAALGHNHIIRARGISGKIYTHPDIKQTGVQLQIPVEEFSVDEKQLRAESGEKFASIPSEQDIAATRHNMLSSAILNAAQFPNIDILSVSVEAPRPETINTLLRISLRGATHDLPVSTTIQHQANQLIITGTAEILQTDFGIKPFSILMGAIAIQNAIKVKFHLTASPQLK